LLAVAEPTTMQLPPGLQATEPSVVEVAPAGAIEVWSVQRVPSHVTANEEAPSAPTAVHADSDVHDTLVRPLAEDPCGAGRGTGWGCHVVPVENSAIAKCCSGPAAVPTATHEAAGRTHR